MDTWLWPLFHSKVYLGRERRGRVNCGGRGRVRERARAGSSRRPSSYVHGPALRDARDEMYKGRLFETPETKCTRAGSSRRPRRNVHGPALRDARDEMYKGRLFETPEQLRAWAGSWRRLGGDKRGSVHVSAIRTRTRPRPSLDWRRWVVAGQTLDPRDQRLPSLDAPTRWPPRLALVGVVSPAPLERGPARASIGDGGLWLGRRWIRGISVSRA
jgi:hypothetical protein